MPVAMPTWRNVELMPEAMPERSTVTTPTAVDASGVLIMPTPTPHTIRPGIRCVHDESAWMPCDEQQTDAEHDEARPDQPLGRARAR